jgi:hypothetical protein
MTLLLTSLERTHALAGTHTTFFPQHWEAVHTPWKKNNLIEVTAERANQLNFFHVMIARRKMCHFGQK